MNPSTSAKQKPETKFGPFAGGMSVVIWRNSVETEDGLKEIRSVTINPRRYKDPDSGEWRNGSFKPVDLPTLVLALQSAQQFMVDHPLPQPAEDEAPEAQEEETF